MLDPTSFWVRLRSRYEIGSDIISKSDSILVPISKEELLPLSCPISKRERTRSRNQIREVGSESVPIRIRCAYWVPSKQCKLVWSLCHVCRRKPNACSKLVKWLSNFDFQFVYHQNVSLAINKLVYVSLWQDCFHTLVTR